MASVDYLTVGIVLIAALFLLRHFTQKKSGSCGKGCGCSKKK